MDHYSSALEEAAQLAHKHQGLGIGVHMLSITPKWSSRLGSKGLLTPAFIQRTWTLRNMSSLVPSRAVELQALTEPAFREYIDRAGIRLVHYRGI